MNLRITLLGLMTMLLLMSLNVVFADTISWDFEDGNDHGFTLRCLLPAAPADDDPEIAGDESITGVIYPSEPSASEAGLPMEGVAWTIGPPDQFDWQFPAVVEGCHVVDDYLQYSDCNDPFSAAVGDSPFDFTNGRGQSSYLNTYNLSQWGDDLHVDTNDQIATSPKVVLGENAELTVWAFGNSGYDDRIAPDFDLDPAEGYTTGSGGIAVLSAAGDELLASLLVTAQGGNGTMPAEFTLDLSEFSGMEVIIEAVDAFQGAWGWLAFDEIQIINASAADTKVENGITHVNSFHLAQNYPNPFNPSTNIEFEIQQQGHVTLSVFNTLGQPVATLMDQELKSGTHQVTFDAANSPAGIYYYRIQVDGFSQVKKMMLLK